MQKILTMYKGWLVFGLVFFQVPTALRVRNLAFKLDKAMPSSVLWRNPVQDCREP